MSKTISAGLRTHLDGTVTSLTTIWRLDRTDGEIFYFTDHDTDIPFDDGDGEQIYTARTGYNRTAVANNVGLSVDNLDVEGVFDSADITDTELRAGLFDHADIRVSLVNWKDLTQGALKIRRGKLGEVVTTPSGIFRAELRGLAQQLSQNIVDNYQAECRADLGDSKCMIPIRPPVLGRAQAVLVGENYRVPTLALTGINWGNIFANISFEDGLIAEPATDIPGWTIVTGPWRLAGTREGLAADDGTQYLQGGDGLSGEILQAVDLTLIGVDLTAIDAGNVTADFSIRRANNVGSDTGRVLVEFLDSLGAPTGTLLDTGNETILPLDTWATRSAVAVAIPTTSRQIRIRLFHNRVLGTESNACFDNIVMSMVDTATTNTFQDIYEDRIYEVTVAGTTATPTQPVYDETIGMDTVDGTATLTARDSFTRNGEVLSIVDRQNMTVSVSDARAVDGWFNGGALIFESGLNAGHVEEIKDWVQTGGALQLFLIAPFDVVPGTKIRLYPGCDKRLTICSTKFDNVINFRGEPYVPGQDELTSTPDAR